MNRQVDKLMKIFQIMMIFSFSIYIYWYKYDLDQKVLFICFLLIPTIITLLLIGMLFFKNFLLRPISINFFNKKKRRKKEKPLTALERKRLAFKIMVNILVLIITVLIFYIVNEFNQKSEGIIIINAFKSLAISVILLFPISIISFYFEIKKES